MTDVPTLLAQAFLVIVPMVLSLTVHEYAHAWAAKKLGDDTAERMGRLTLNPLAHADPLGTFILPLLILVSSGMGGVHVPFFGWAKPVPVNPNQFRRTLSHRVGSMWVALAGPMSNLFLAIVCAAILSGFLHGGSLDVLAEPVQSLLLMMLSTNIGLFVFNMIPIYPLDGHRVVAGLLQGERAVQFERFNYQFGSTLLLMLVVFGRGILSLPMGYVTLAVQKLVGLQ